MNIFEELGIHRYINAQDTFTKYGGKLHASMQPASHAGNIAQLCGPR